MSFKKGEYNLHYSDERTIKYNTCNYWEVPAYPTLMELWSSMMDYLEKERIAEEKKMFYKRGESSNTKRFRKTARNNPRFKA